MNEVKVLKLNTGEEIVAEIEDMGSYWKVKNPVRFAMVPLDDNRIGMEMQPFIMLSEDSEFEILKSNVITCGNPIGQILQSYSNQFSDLVVPQGKKLIV